MASAYERLSSTLASFGEEEERTVAEGEKMIDEEEGLVRRVQSSSSSGVAWDLDIGMEEAEYGSSLLLLERDDGIEAWLGWNRSVSEKWRAAAHRLEAAVHSQEDASQRAIAMAESYRLEASFWSLAESLWSEDLLLGHHSEESEAARSNKTSIRMIPWSTAEDAAIREVKGSESSRRRTVTLLWLEQCAEERIYNPESPHRNEETEEEVHPEDIDCVEGVLARLAAAAANNSHALTSAAIKWSAKAEALARAAENELEAQRSAWSLCRCGRWKDAAAVDDAVRAHWRAAATMARGYPGYDAHSKGTGNARRELWREICAARARQALKAADLLRQYAAQIEDAFCVHGTMPKPRAGGQSAVARGCALTAAAADIDACRHAALASDLSTLRSALARLPCDQTNIASEDAAWAQLLCLSDAAANDAARRQSHEDGQTIILAPELAPPPLPSPEAARILTLASSGIASVLELVLGDQSKHHALDDCLRISQARLAGTGLSPQLLSAVMPSSSSNDAEQYHTRRLRRLAAQLGAAWKHSAVPRSDTSVRQQCENALSWYALDLGRRGFAPLAAAYALHMDRGENRVSALASAMQYAHSVADRRACAQALEKCLSDSDERAEVARRACALTIAHGFHDQADDEHCARALDWLAPYGPRAFSPAPHGIQLLRQASLLARRWALLDRDSEVIQSIDTLGKRERGTIVVPSLLSAEASMRRLSLLEAHVPMQALDEVLDLCRASDMSLARAAATALKEYLMWRLWLRALDRIQAWRRAMAACEDDSDIGDSTENVLFTSTPQRPTSTTIRKQRRITLQPASPQSQPRKTQQELDAAISDLVDAAGRARLSLELVATFPGTSRLDRARWGAALPQFTDYDDDEDLGWRLDALCATLARRTELNVPIDGFLAPTTDPVPFAHLAEECADEIENLQTLRATLLSDAVHALLHIVRQTGDALTRVRAPHQDCAVFYKAGIAVADFMTKPDGILKLFTRDDAARILDRITKCTMELVRHVPQDAIIVSEDSSSTTTQDVPAGEVADINWDRLLS